MEFVGNVGILMVLLLLDLALDFDLIAGILAGLD